ncbi:MAG: TetR/AcrR family transcriptional regulator [Deltaproteobacteria bacterium]
MREKEYSLREKKHARTKLAIMRAFMELLKRNRFDDISIKKICGKAEVAQGTFFNYFPEKIDVISYYVHLTTLKMIWKAQHEAPSGRYLPRIDSFFNQLSVEMNNSNLIYQILAVLLLQAEKPKKPEISELEKRITFPDENIGETPAMTLDEWFRECVSSAKKNGELVAVANVEDIVISLTSILSGTLLATRFMNGNSRGYHYVRQLNILWHEFGVKT